MEILLTRGESVVLLIDPRDTRDQGWVLTGDVLRVYLTLRETEAAEPILRVDGLVEAIGTSVTDPGKLGIFLHTQDLMAVPTGAYWYDVTMIVKGHWFDIVETDGLYLTLDYGRLRKDDGTWVEIEGGVVELTDDEVNFVGVKENGEYTVDLLNYDADAYPLYRIVTAGGEVVATFPGEDWFAEDAGSHSGLDFAYDAGEVLAADNTLTAISAGAVTLKPEAVNFVEVDAVNGVAANITRFTPGRYPLFKVTTDETDVDAVVAQSQDFRLDDRTEYVRGDMRVPTNKARANVTWTPGQPDEEAPEED